MTPSSSVSASNTKEQTGSITISRKAMWTGPNRIGIPNSKRHQRQPRDGHMHGKDEAHRLAQVVVDAPPQPDGGDDGAEIIIQQHDGGRLARHIGAAPAHRHADIGGLQRWRVIHPVAGHRHDRARGLAARSRCAASVPA